MLLKALPAGIEAEKDRTKVRPSFWVKNNGCSKNKENETPNLLSQQQFLKYISSSTSNHHAPHYLKYCNHDQTWKLTITFPEFEMQIGFSMRCGRLAVMRLKRGKLICLSLKYTTSIQAAHAVNQHEL